MGTPIDPQALVSNMQAAATEAIGSDVTKLRGFAQQQLQAIAQQAVFVAAGIVDGSINTDLQDYFLDGIEDMTKSFVNTLSGMVTVMIEQVWNAMVGAIWAAINTATGLSLVAP